MDKQLLRAIVKIAHYTHFDYDTISQMSIDEVNDILEIIKESEHNLASQKLAIVDYQILLSREFDKKQQSEAKKCQAQAQKIRNILTGVKPKKSSLLSVFQSFGIYTNKKIKE